MKIATILDQIDAGFIALPEFQRGYVWNRDQVREFREGLGEGFHQTRNPDHLIDKREFPDNKIPDKEAP